MTRRAFGVLLMLFVVRPSLPIVQTQESHADELVVFQQFMFEVDVAEDGFVSSRRYAIDAACDAGF